MDPALRSTDPKTVRAALAKLTKLAGDVETEVIAIGFAHPDGATRKAAMTLVDKHVKDAKLFRATLGTRFHSDYASKASKALRSIKRKDRGALAVAMTRLGAHVDGVAFEEDREFGKAAVYRQLVEKDKQLSLGSLDDEDIELTMIPDVVFDEIKGLRKKLAFDWVHIWGSEIEELPKRFVEFAPFLKKVTFAYQNFASMPAVLFECKNLEEIELIDFNLQFVDAGIAKLTKLKKLRLHSSKQMRQFPVNVALVPNLEVLDLGMTKRLAKLDGISKCKSLVELDLQSSAIRKLPPEIASMPKLKKLIVRWTGVTKDAAKALVGKGVTVEA